MKHCSVNGCDRKHYARGLCEAHYRRRQRTGSVDDQRAVGAQILPAPCSAPGCTRLSEERSLCHPHYLRLIRHGDVLSERPVGRRASGACAVPACDEDLYARGLCRIHYRRLRRTGDVQADVPIRARSEAGSISHGYRVVKVPEHLRWLVNGRRTELEHRLVMAQLLGRPLTPDESVHHKNGDRLCNDASNLELWTRWQPTGQRLSDRLHHAIQLLERYAPELLAGGGG